ncbi:MAG: hypothetical protein ACOZFS_10185 [Thermodesulfobacteriota bacterium]
MEDMDYQTYRHNKIEKITAKALELKELNQRAIEAILSNDVSSFLDIAYNFYEIRDGLKQDLHHFVALTINNENARPIINKISTNEPFEVENMYNKLIEIMEKKAGEPIFDCDLFRKAHQWFSIHYDFLDIFTRRHSFGPIALKLTKHNVVDSYINEAF